MCEIQNEFIRRKKMKLHKIAIATVALMLAMTAMSFASDKVAVAPDSVTLTRGLPPSQITLNGFCSDTPCDPKWTIVLSNDGVGELSATSGPQVKFHMGDNAGTAWVFFSDGHGELALAIIKVN
jgi:hypothetical protein